MKEKPHEWQNTHETTNLTSGRSVLHRRVGFVTGELKKMASLYWYEDIIFLFILILYFAIVHWFFLHVMYIILDRELIRLSSFSVTRVPWKHATLRADQSQAVLSRLTRLSTNRMRSINFWLPHVQIYKRRREVRTRETIFYSFRVKFPCVYLSVCCVFFFLSLFFSFAFYQILTNIHVIVINDIIFTTFLWLGTKNLIE